MIQIYKISTLLIPAVSLLLGLFVFFKNRRNPTNVSFLLMNIFIAAWSLAIFIQIHSSAQKALFLAKFSSVCGFFILPSFLYFFLSMANKIKEYKSLLKFSYLSSILVLLFAVFFPDQFLSVKDKIGIRNYIDARPFYYVYTFLYLFILALSIKTLFGIYKNSFGIQRMQIKYVILASIIGFPAGLSMFPLCFDLDFVFSPHLFSFLLLYPVIIAYAIICHRLMDITIIIRRSLVYSLMVAFISIIYIASIIVGQQVLGVRFGMSSWLMFLLAGVIITIGFKPLEKVFARLTYRIFFKRRIDYKDVVKELIRDISSCIRFKELFNVVNVQLPLKLKLNFCRVYILAGIIEKQIKQDIDEKHNMDLEVQPISPFLIEVFNRYKKSLSLDDIERDLQENRGIKLTRPELLRIKDVLISGNIVLAIPLIRKDILIGILFIGRKLSKDMFNDDELQWLEVLATQIAVAVENIILLENEELNIRKISEAEVHSNYIDVLKKANSDLKSANQRLKNTRTQLIQTSRVAAVGELSSGVAKEISDPLTGILGNIQFLIFKLKENPKKQLKEFINILDTIEKSSIRCQEITKSLLYYSRSGLTRKIVSIDVNESIENALTLVKRNLELEGITINKQLQQKDILLIKANPGQIQQVILNLILNGQWAMSNIYEKQLTIKTEFDKQNMRIRIIVQDTGIGIPEQNLNKIFEPFFTTRAQTGEVGLGLSISLGIVKELGGNIEVESQIGKGSKFIVELPTERRND